MNQRTPTQTAPRRVQGSWEDLLAQAQQHAANFNDAAIPLYEKVLDGLMALPEPGRRSAKGRLHKLMMLAGLELQGYFNVRDGFDEALAVVEKLKTVAGADEQAMLETLTTNILRIAGRTDEVVARLQTAADAPNAGLAAWGALVEMHLENEQPAAALALVERLDALLQEKLGDRDDAEAHANRTYVAGLRAFVNLESGQVDEAIRLFEPLAAPGGEAAGSLPSFYARLVQLGRYDDALPFIGIDQRTRPARAGFWRGVVYHHKGNMAQARVAFEHVAAMAADQVGKEGVLEYMLARYYLGDPEATALDLALRIIREMPAPRWMFFYLAAMGWVLRGDMGATRTNLQVAVAQRKSSASGTKLPRDYWFFTKDIAPPDKLEALQPFFELGEFA